MLTVAFATSDGTAVDQHFGWCDRFDVYELSAERVVLRESRRPAGAGDSDGRIDARIEAVRDCAILHVTSIGGAAAARVVHAGIHPLKVAEGTPVADLTARLRGVLAGNPPPWLRKALQGPRPVGGGPC